MYTLPKQENIYTRIKLYLRRRYHCIEVTHITGVGILTLAYSHITKGPIPSIMFIPQQLIDAIIIDRDLGRLNEIEFMQEFFEVPLLAKREYVRRVNYLSDKL